MLCDSCNKLATLYTTKKCMKCQGSVTQNISVVCEACSNSNQSCSACLKKMIKKDYVLRSHATGCRSCGQK